MERKRVLAAAAVLAVVLAGVVGYRQLTGDGADTVPVPPPAAIGTELDLPTTSWEPGDDAMAAQGGGVLRVDDDDCVYLVGSGRWYVAWPAGYSAFQDDGELTLYGEDGDAVAHDGDRLELGGGYLHVTGDSEHACLPDVGQEYFVVNSGVTVVQAAR